MDLNATINIGSSLTSKCGSVDPWYYATIKASSSSSNSNSNVLMFVVVTLSVVPRCVVVVSKLLWQSVGEHTSL